MFALFVCFVLFCVVFFCLFICFSFFFAAGRNIIYIIFFSVVILSVGADTCRINRNQRKGAIESIGIMNGEKRNIFVLGVTSRSYSALMCLDNLFCLSLLLKFLLAVTCEVFVTFWTLQISWQYIQIYIYIWDKARIFSLHSCFIFVSFVSFKLGYCIFWKSKTCI